MSVHLLDSNVLIALSIAEHEHHAPAREWFTGAGAVALCPITEGALIRTLLRLGESGATAETVLERISRHPRVQFWPDGLSYTAVGVGDLTGHRQVTDAYLVAVATHHDGRLATFDRALAARHPEACTLLGD